jgi:hypothetical protein
MRSTVSLIAGPLLAAFVACTPSTPPPGPCASPNDCPTNWVCLFGVCTSPATIVSNLSAIVVPAEPGLAPQQYLPFELNPSGMPQASIAILMHQPQQLVGQFALPPGCEGPSVLPVNMTFNGNSKVPGVPWSFASQTTSLGQATGVLPAFENFEQTISPSVSCTPPILGTHRVLQPGPFNVGQLAFLQPADSLRIVGSLITQNETGVGTIPTGVLVTILPAPAVNSDQALSITVATDAGASFELQVPFSQAVGPSPTNCDAGSCDGGAGGLVATVVLEVQPSPSFPKFPSMSLLVSIPVAVDAGSDAGADQDGGLPNGGTPQPPIAYLVGAGGGPFVLPYDNSQDVLISGITESPDGGVAPDLTVQIASLFLETCDVPDCVYRASVLSGDDGRFNFTAPPGSYAITVVPQYISGVSEWFPKTVDVSCTAALPCNNLGIPVEAGVPVTGLVLLPNGSPFNNLGTAAVYSLPDMNLLVQTRLDTEGRFRLTAPQGRDLLIITPDVSTGYPAQFFPLDEAGSPLDLVIQLSNPGLLSGTVSIEGIDGGQFLPVAGASVQFYYVISDPVDPDGGEIAFPWASTLTDDLGNFAAIGRPIPP